MVRNNSRRAYVGIRRQQTRADHRFPSEPRSLIRRKAAENPLWGEERIANELLVELGIRVSPRTVRKYMPKRPPGHPRGDQCWPTFLRNHAKAILACEFFVGEEGGYRYLTHDRDMIFAKHLDDSIRALGIEVLRSPLASLKANAICVRVIGTIRRECLDWLIPLSEAYLRSILRSWVELHNRGRPYRAEVVPKSENRHRLAAGVLVLAKSVLGGLHHEYSIATLSRGA